MIKTLVTSATLLAAMAVGTPPAAAFVHTTPDLAGRPAGHAMYGHDALEEDQEGWDCRYQGNRICGADDYDSHVIRLRLHLCDSYAARIGTQEQWISCAARAYERPIWRRS